MKKIVAILSIVSALLLGSLTVSAQDLGGVSVNSWSIKSIRPTSFTSMDASVSLNLTSTRSKTVITDISGIIYDKAGNAFIIGTADDLTIQKGTATVVVVGHGSLESYSALRSVLANLSIKPENYTADVTATVKTGMQKPHQVEMKGVKLSDVLK